MDLAEYDHQTALANEKRARLKLRDHRRAVKASRDARNLLVAIGEAAQNEAHARISDIVTACLEAVFDDPYTFRIVFEQKRGRTEARLVFQRDGLEVDPLSASGGGVVDVAAFALRAACLSLARPRRRMLMVLDEPFKFVSAEYRARIGDMLERMSDELNIQFVIVTHIDELQLGKVVRL